MHQQQQTLQASFPLGRTFILTLLILALMAATAEGFARIALADQPTAIGSTNPTLDVKIGVLDQLADEAGGVDCIFLGSSVVLNAIKPAVFADAYRRQTGHPLTCYNFGIPALTARTAGVLAEVLVNRYQPDLLVYGFTLRALAADSSQADEVYNAIVGTPWLQYQRGEFTPTGWLVTHSTAMKTYLALRNWIKPDYLSWRSTFTEATPGGYQRYLARETAIDMDAIRVPDYFAHYTQSPAEFAGLAQIVAQQDQVNVLLLEMPLPVQFVSQFDGGTAAYTATLDALAAYAGEHDVPLWTTSPLELIPNDGWAEDAHHVNSRGMQIFSTWLGEQIGHTDLVKD